ncbi:ABC transporter ATP-binding protein [Propionibacterium freudenreichii]|uniref:ABC transporter ATP-binding protein n=1 Tax=Propionibacterium freudenreichii TaxID=1744 RepID=UPI0021A4FA4F|nr:ABC transporter ATP-binding protein [Propionibacterium freudenreichii]MCT2997244.1 ABC transporter ATP-binding protein [Propionibacterium freudenreichii]MCT3001844.1 ABC transporter ATP-binding protein [Propionibacterium freudenreichii]MDK9658120.1 ABC transporter ATP-binding protein [Propionibacterium freudenreichii]
MNTVLDVRGLHKHFGKGAHRVEANAGVTMAAHAGQVVGLLGHNGSGKTTMVNQIVGLTRPDSGTITVGGIDATTHPALARRLVSLQAQANVPITGLTPRRAIELVGRMRGAPARAMRSRARELIKALDIGPWADVASQKVSGGIARLTAFAMCLARPAPLVVLDEPTNDVDPVRRRLLWTQIRRLADAGHAVLLVTHNVRETERVVDRLVVLNHGQVLAQGTPATLVHDRAGMLTLEVDQAPGQPPHWPAGITATPVGDHRSRAVVASDRAAALVAWAADELRTGAIERYELSPVSLEDAYIDLVTGHHPAAAGADADQPDAAPLDEPDTTTESTNDPAAGQEHTA